MRTGLGPGCHAHEGPVQLNVFRGEGEPPAVGYGVACIDAQVHQDLMQLRGIADDGPQVRVQVRDQFDVLGESFAHD